MPTLLFIKASPRGARSHSLAVAEALLAPWRAQNPGWDVDILDLFTEDLPPFDGHTIQGKYNIMHGLPHTDQDKQAWAAAEAIIDRFLAAQKYLLAVPMWNFAIPYRLKHYIDIICQPTYTFAANPDGSYAGLVTGRKAFIAYARGGQYPAGTPAAAYNHQSPYLEFILGFMGITDVSTVAVEGTLMGKDAVERSRLQALAAAQAMAAGF